MQKIINVGIEPWVRNSLIGIIAADIILCIVQGVLHPASGAFMFLLVNSLFKLFPVFILLRHRDWGLLHPVVLFSLLWTPMGLVNAVKAAINPQLFLSVPPYLVNHLALPDWPVEALMQLQIAKYSFWLAALLIYYLAFGLRIGPKLPDLTLASDHEVKTKMLWVIAFSLCVFIIYIYFRGGVGVHLASWRTGRFSALAGTGIWYCLINFGILACLTWFAVDRKASKNTLFWIALLVSCVTNFLASGSRSTIMLAFMILMLISVVHEGRINFFKALCTFILCLFIFGALGTFRVFATQGKASRILVTSIAERLWGGKQEKDVKARARSSRKKIKTAPPDEFKKRAHMVGDLAIFGNVPGKMDFLQGVSYLNFLATPVPRSLWPGKPRGVGSLVSQTFYNMPRDKGGVPAGMLGESYWNFGLSGIIFVFFLYGLFHKWLWAVFEKYSVEVFIPLYLLTVYQLSFETSTMSKYMITTFPFIILLVISRIISFKIR